MKNVFNIICLFFIGLFVSCNSLSKEVELSNEIRTIIKDNALSLKDISISKDWDSVYIVKPYCKIDDLKFDMDFISKREIKSNAAFDDICTILFIRNGELVAFSIIKRNIIDLTNTTKEVYDKEDIIVTK